MAKSKNTSEAHPEAVSANEQLSERLGGNEKYYLMTSKKELADVVASVQDTFKDVLPKDRYQWHREECDKLEKEFEETKKVPECINIVGRMVSHLNECLTHYNASV